MDRTDTKKLKKKPRLKIECACGCGQTLVSVDRKGRNRRFVQGHNNRGKRWYWLDEAKARLKGISRRDIKGSANPLWKGGQIKDSHGYIWILKPEHPFATKQGYVREHRLVLEGKLGRFLLPSEVPHHINGIKHDNRPENLELYTNQSSHLKEGHFAKNLH